MSRVRLLTIIIIIIINPLHNNVYRNLNRIDYVYEIKPFHVSVYV